MQQQYEILSDSGGKVNNEAIIKHPSQKTFNDFYSYTNKLRDDYDLACENQLTQNEGKWIIAFENQDKALDTAWIKTLELLECGLLYSVKVAGYNENYNSQIMCIYTKNAKDKDDVLLILEILLFHNLHKHCRSIGYKSNQDTFENNDVRSYEEEKNSFINEPYSLTTLKLKKNRIRNEKAKIAFDNLIQTIQNLDTDDWQIKDILKLMHQSLSPCENRKQAQMALCDLGDTLAGSPKRHWQAMGVLLAVFGTAIMVGGALLTGIGGIGLVIGGGMALVVGLGLFAHHHRKGLSEKVAQFSAKMEINDLL